MAPRTSYSKCSVAMSCPDGYNLILHDTNTSTMFGSDVAEGFCNPSTQKWRINNHQNFDRMYGLCVDFTKPRTWSPPPPEHNCVCPYTLVNYTNMKYHLGYHNYYVSHLSQYRTSYPKLSMDSSGTCPDKFDCGSLQKVLIVDGKVSENPEEEFVCNPQGYWNSSTSSQGARHLFVTCMDLSKPLSPPTPKCNCTSEIIPNESSRAKPWLLVGDQISDDRCIWTIYCFYYTDLKLFNNPNSDVTQGYIWQGKCNPKTDQWDMIWEPYWGKTYRNVPAFGLNCVFYM
ncbi:unnamed protein product [Caenorhabditis brenneri]